MRKLSFKCNGQKLTRSGDFSGIVAGSKGYLCVTIDFGVDWKSMAKVAEFRVGNNKDIYPVLIRNGACEVPNEVTDGRAFYVRIVGKHGDQRVRTNEVIVRQEG